LLKFFVWNICSYLVLIAVGLHLSLLLATRQRWMCPTHLAPGRRAGTQFTYCTWWDARLTWRVQLVIYQDGLSVEQCSVTHAGNK